MALDLRSNFISAQYLEQIDIISPNFIYAFMLTRSSLGLLHVIFFPKFVLELWPLNYTRNLVSAKYLENKLTEFHQVYIQTDNI